jgi:hypothetical protein
VARPAPYAPLVGPEASLAGTASSTPARCRVFNPHGTYGGQGKAAGLRDTGGFAVLNAAGIARGALRLSFAATPPAADGWDRPMCAMVCLAVGCAIKNGSHQEPFYPHERYAIIERMKTGDKAFLRLDGVVCVGTVKRAPIAIRRSVGNGSNGRRIIRVHREIFL